MLGEATRLDRTTVNLADLPGGDVNLEVVECCEPAMFLERYEAALTAQGLDQPTSMLP
jgi:hypothetical protein